MAYLNKEFLLKEQTTPVTYISFVEVNSYFRNNGIYKKMCNEVIKVINPNQYIVTTCESKQSEKCSVLKIFKESLMNSGFKKIIWVHDDLYVNQEFYNLVCEDDKVLSLNIEVVKAKKKLFRKKIINKYIY